MWNKDDDGTSPEAALSTSKPILICVWGHHVLLENPLWSKFQTSCHRFPVKQENSEVVLCFLYLTHTVQGTSTTVNKSGSQHDTTTTMPDSWNNDLSFESLNLTPSNKRLVIVSKQLSLCLL
ncbi:hypothetical protein XENORESO_005587 [Xenotaenia resolanae]|uniref:Uncharacterized protein n=1 Tax=Xenotaenia resolanae TaxID=208358 RepID=A0ABV0VYH7_9TELE